MERISTMALCRCYKATVNESETITEAQPFVWFVGRGGTGELRAFGIVFAAAPHLERS
jgi:hypothetical protein